MNVKLFIILLILPFHLDAQGFAGLGQTPEGFAQPAPDPIFSFPQDHGAHSDYRIEWWYLTANLTGEDGLEYGLQWTLFRTSLAPEDKEGWASSQLWMGHAAVTTPDAHYVTERLARGGVGQAGVRADPFEAWIDDWAFTGPFDRATLRATGPAFGYDMTMQANGPLVFHGDAGYSRKSANDQASYYYSQPYFQITGTLHLPDNDVRVVGDAWLDREWSSQPLASDQTGWDWFSLSLKGGAKLMGFQLRGDDTYTSATWIEADGTTTPFPNGAFSALPLGVTDIEGRKVPTLWQVQLPDKGIDVTVEAVNPNAWMETSVPYWEGPVRVNGSHQGRGYLEMTGYDGVTSQ